MPVCNLRGTPTSYPKSKRVTWRRSRCRGSIQIRGCSQDTGLWGRGERDGVGGCGSSVTAATVDGNGGVGGNAVDTRFRLITLGIGSGESIWRYKLYGTIQ